MTPKKWLPAALLAALFTGGVFAAGGRIDSMASLDKIKPGVTTAQQVRDMFGPPARNMSFPRQGVDAIQYDATEYASHIGWGHGCVDEVVALAMTANVKRLYLFHHDPTHDDRIISSMVMHARALAEAAGNPIRIEGAREGDVVTLPARVAAVAS